MLGGGGHVRIAVVKGQREGLGHTEMGLMPPEHWSNVIAKAQE